MSPEDFIKHALQYDQRRDQATLQTFVSTHLRHHREVVVPLLSRLLERGARMRESLMPILLRDGAEDVLPYILQICRMERERDKFEEYLSALADYAHPGALDVLECLNECVTPSSEPVWRRARGKLRARFRTHYQASAFSKAKGGQLVALADAMIRAPHADYKGVLYETLKDADPERADQALRVLSRIDEERLGARIPALLEKVRARLGLAEAFSSLALLRPDAPLPDRPRLILMFCADPATPWQTSQHEALLAKVAKEHKPSRSLLEPYQLGEPASGAAARLVDGIISGQLGLDNQALRNAMKRWRSKLQLLEQHYLQAAGKCAARNPSLTELIDKGTATDRDRLHNRIWMLAGSGDEKAAGKLVEMLNQHREERTVRTILEALKHVDLPEVPDSIQALARNTTAHGVRRKAIELIARSEYAAPTLEQLLIHAPLVVKDDVGAVIASQQLTSCHKMLLGCLAHKNSDSFRLILLKTLEAFDDPLTGGAAQAFVPAPHSLPLRLAAVQTILAAGGPQRLASIIAMLDLSVNDRHQSQVLLAFIEGARTLDLEKYEDQLLEHRSFFESLLHNRDETVRLETISLLEGFSWLSEHREGWVGTLQKALQTLVQQRSESEIERIRHLLERLSAMFESERKRQALKARLNNIASGLSHHSRLERLQALKQLDWIFRPEMISGDPEGVRRLVKRIERVMDDDEGDTPIEVLAIEIAGKIGHPVLRKKIRDYLDHPSDDIMRAAETALSQPVNQVLLANMIKVVFHMDDSAYMTNLVGTILRKEGYEAYGANDPNEAFEILKQRDYDLLVLDLNMPAMRGVDFLRYVRRLGLAPRYTFVLTSVRNKEDLVEVFEMGVDGVMLKPFKAEDLLEKVGELKAKCL